MKEKGLKDFTEEVVALFKKYEETGTPPWTYKTAVQDLSYQVGSLTKAVMQLEGERHAEGKSKEEMMKKVGDELADIFAEVLFIAHELNISLEEAWDQMLESDRSKIESRKNA